MNQSEFNKKYLTENPASAANKAPNFAHQLKIKKDKGFSALLNYLETGKLKTKEEASKIIHFLGYKEDEFGQWLFDQLEKGKSFEPVKKFTEMGLLPKTWVSRTLKYRDLENKIPPKYHAEFGIRASYLLKQKIASLSARISR